MAYFTKIDAGSVSGKQRLYLQLFICTGGGGEGFGKVAVVCQADMPGSR